MPYFAANQAALLYPINLLCYALGPHQFWVVAVLVRRLGAGPLGALLGGGVYMFAAFNVVWLHFAIHNVAAVLPLALWLILRLIVRYQRRDLLALAGVVAAQFLGGHPETSLFFMVVCGSFATTWLVGRASGCQPSRSSSAARRCRHARPSPCRVERPQPSSRWVACIRRAGATCATGCCCLRRMCGVLRVAQSIAPGRRQR